MKPVTLTIDSLGAQGDGLALHEGERVHVPFTLPGERVEAALTGKGVARLQRVLNPSPDRVEPQCQHFGACGGCRFQHMSDGAIARFKRESLVRALSARGIEADIGPTVPGLPGTRRRAVLAARRAGKGQVALGLHRRSGHEVVDFVLCPVLDPQIARLLPQLRGALAPVLPQKGEASLTLTACDNGVDLHVVGLAEDLAPSLMMGFTGQVLAAAFIRVTVGKADQLMAQPPVIAVGRAQLTPPPGGFLQATREAEAAMAALVVEAMGGCKSVADLYAGSGTFALRLAQTANVHAVEGIAQPLEALRLAHARAAGLRPVTTQVRDLARQPLAPQELERFDGAVLDPPFAGALTQAQSLAKLSAGRGPGRLAYVSCNPASLARDLRVLLDGGWRLVRATPIDAFVWSAHVETVAILER